MENTLLPGDFVLVNKFSYTLTTPKEVPFLGLKLPYINIHKFGDPELKDLIIFNYNGNIKSDTITVAPKLVKRIVACPGDTLEIKNKVVFINGKALDLPATIKQYEENKKTNWIDDEDITPPEISHNKDNYGPLVIPGAGDTIFIDFKNFNKYKELIETDYGDSVLRREDRYVTLEGAPIEEYIILKNYYFVMGDNVDVSLDSRNFGLITEDSIYGEVIIIYWSMNYEKMAPGPLGFLSAIRADRLFKGVE